MINKIELKTYWFFNTGVPTHLPKQITVLKIDGNVALFNDYIVNEKFADIRVVKDSLFNNLNEAMIKFAELVADPNEMNFIEQDIIEQVKLDYPEAFL